MNKLIIKWSGRKTYLTPYIDKYLSEKKLDKFNYHEPFLGSGAIFFHLANQKKIEKSYLNDMLKELVILYEVLQTVDLYNFIKKINEEVYKYSHHENGIKRAYNSKNKIYKEWRNEFNILISKDNINNLGRNNKIKLTRLFLLLNYSCFNGVYRKNPEGIFNVPQGRVATKNGVKRNSISIPDKKIFENFISLINETKSSFSSVDFKVALKKVKKGDLVYLDPPYYDSVNYYNESTFSKQNQEELKEEMIRLVKLGAHVIMSNSKSKECKTLYKSDLLNIKEIPITRTIQRKKNKNGIQYKEDKKELFITS